jgi:hypothetical protein
MSPDNAATVGETYPATQWPYSVAMRRMRNGVTIMAHTATTDTGRLTAKEMRALVVFKWVYALEASGFTKDEAMRLMFHRWRIARQNRSE